MDLRALAALWSAARGPRFRKASPASRARRLTTAILILILAADLCVAIFWAGNTTGSRLAVQDASGLGRTLWRIPLTVAVAGALWDGGCVVNPAPCRPYFIALRTMVLAEGMLGLTTPVKAILAGLGLVFSLGLAWGRPALFPLGLLYVALAILWVAALERVVHTLFPAGLLRQRTFLTVILVLGVAMAFLAWLGGGILSAPWLSAVEQICSQPGIELVRFWQTRNLGHLAVPMLATMGLLALAGGCVALELSRDRKAGAALGGGRPWTFLRPWVGIARLQFHQILSSRAGQVRLLALMLSVLLAKEPELITVGVLKAPHAWSGIAAGLTFGAVLVVPLCNLLGYDRAGVQTWFRVPVAARDVLLGKVMGCAAYGAMAAPILLALVFQAQTWHFAQSSRAGKLHFYVMHSGSPLGWGEVLAMAFLLTALFLWWAGSGLERSLKGAWPMTMGSYGVKMELDDEKMARIGVLLAPLAWMGPLFAVALLLGWPAAATLMAGVAGLSAVRLQRCLEKSSRVFHENREAITLALMA